MELVRGILATVLKKIEMSLWLGYWPFVKSISSTPKGNLIAIMTDLQWVLFFIRFSYKFIYC